MKNESKIYDEIDRLAAESIKANAKMAPLTGQVFKPTQKILIIDVIEEVEPQGNLIVFQLEADGNPFDVTVTESRFFEEYEQNPEYYNDDSVDISGEHVDGSGEFTYEEYKDKVLSGRLYWQIEALQRHYKAPEPFGRFTVINNSK